jgi:nucleolar protein 56
LLYNASFVGKAGQKNKGRISRLLANKCSMAARIDHFSPVPTSLYGEAMKRQVEERLAFYSDGTKPSKNISTMVSGRSHLQSFLTVNRKMP